MEGESRQEEPPATEAPAITDPELLHRQNVFTVMRHEEHQDMLKLFQRRQHESKLFSERLARLGPKGSLQVLLPPPPGRGLPGKRAARLSAILENTAVEAALEEAGEKRIVMEPGLTRVPIKLDLETDGYKLRDGLLWCINDVSSVQVDDFAAMTCEDFELPLSIFQPLISKAITEQLAEYQDFLGMLKMMGGLKEFVGIRGLIRLDITIEGLSLVDKFEWDLGETRNSPEAFAAAYARELALPPQFTPAIAIDIYEQVYLLRRSLLQTGFHRDAETGQLGRLNDPDLAELVAIFGTSTSINRDMTRLDEFTPLVTILEAAEMERIELSRDRDARRKRRQAKAKKVESLSVRSPPKTLLTPLEYRGTVHRQLKLAEDMDGERVTGRGRRKAT